jgi:hypothetical protein
MFTQTAPLAVVDEMPSAKQAALSIVCTVAHLQLKLFQQPWLALSSPQAADSAVLYAT